MVSSEERPHLLRLQGKELRPRDLHGNKKSKVVKYQRIPVKYTISTDETSENLATNKKRFIALAQHARHAQNIDYRDLMKATGPGDIDNTQLQGKKSGLGGSELSFPRLLDVRVDDEHTTLERKRKSEVRLSDSEVEDLSELISRQRENERKDEKLRLVAEKFIDLQQHKRRSESRHSDSEAEDLQSKLKRLRRECEMKDDQLRHLEAAVISFQRSQRR